jgi:hypothetical protein
MKPHRWSRIAILTLIGLLKLSISFAQPALPTFTGGEFTAFPATNQLYPRTITNDGQPDIASIIISGTITNTNITSVRVVVTRDDDNDGLYEFGESFQTFNQALSFSGGTASFSFSIDQVAELNNYRYEFFTLINTASTLQTTRSGILVGDAFIVYGQSNGVAERRAPLFSPGGDPELEPNGNFIRTYGNGDPTYANSPKAWALGFGNNNSFQTGPIGQWAKRMASRIVTENEIPVAIINGSFNSASIMDLQRNDADPTDVTGFYGRMLKRVQEANLQNKIRAFFIFQGESDLRPFPNNLSTAEYKTAFNALKADVLADNPSINKIYMFQVKDGCFSNTFQKGLQIVEAQRQLDLDDPMIELISTTNLAQYDDCHYAYDGGYKTIGDRAFAVVSRDLYTPLTGKNLYTPMPLAAQFSGIPTNGIANEITLSITNSGDDIAIVNGSGNIADDFSLAGGDYTINSVSLNNTGSVSSPNWQIKIAFTNSPGTNTNPTSISYLAHRGSATPAIANDNGTGIGLAAFNEFIIADGVLPVDPMQLSVSRMGKQNRLKWTVENNDQFEYFEVERSASRSNFKSIATIEGSGNSGLVRYEADDKLPFAAGNFYRIKGVDINGRVEYSQVVVVTSNRVISEGVIVFPNPVTTYVNATIAVKDAGPAELLLHNSSGQLVSSRKIMLQENNNSISLGELLDHRPGMYILTVVTAGKRYITKIIKTQ